MFFAEIQNKLLYAITWKTAAELVISRVDPKKDNMNLTTWKGSIVRKQDIYTAKNYLDEDELDSLNRLVTIFLETAELRVKDKQDLTMEFWKDNVDKIIDFQNKKLLTWAWSISNDQMKAQVWKMYNLFHTQRKQIEAKKADNSDLDELDTIEAKLKLK